MTQDHFKVKAIYMASSELGFAGSGRVVVLEWNERLSRQILNES
jgi:hypothetical protein